MQTIIIAGLMCAGIRLWVAVIQYLLYRIRSQRAMRRVMEG